MKCDMCVGEGQLSVAKLEAIGASDAWLDAARSGNPVPCPECQGTGIISCCEGSERGGQLEEER